jgi:hypothetical protein
MYFRNGPIDLGVGRSEICRLSPQPLFREGSSVAVQSLVASPQPHHKGPFLARQPLHAPFRDVYRNIDVSSWVWVGALGAESVQYSYAALQRLVLYPTICRPYGSASRLPNGQQSSSSGSVNLSELESVRPCGVKDTCGGSGGPISPLIRPPPPPRSPLGLLQDPTGSWSSEFPTPTTRRWGSNWHLPRAVLVPPDQGLAAYHCVTLPHRVFVMTR